MIASSTNTHHNPDCYETQIWPEDTFKILSFSQYVVAAGSPWLLSHYQYRYCNYYS